MRLKTSANNGDKKSQKVLELVSKPSEFITTILIGNNIANIILPTLVTAIAIDYGIHIGLASALLTILIIIFAEVLPKSVAAAFPDKISALVYPVIRFFVIIFKPVTIILNGLTGSITRVLLKGKADEVSISKEEFKTMVDIADSEGTFGKSESSRIKGVLDFHNLNVKDILKTPRIDLVALPTDSTYEEVRELVLQHPFTRYPIYKGDIDNIIGMFHSKYLIQWSLEPEKPLKNYCDNDPLFVYEFHSVEWIFLKMTKEKKHMAIVLDEYGGTEGIVTHEDIIESMIGLEIEDEMDLASDVLVEKITETEIICDGKITLHRLNTVFGTEIPEEEDVLAGYLLKEFSEFPEEEAILERDNLTFKILEIEGRSIRKVQIIK